MMRIAADTLSRQWTMLKRVPTHPNWISTKDMHVYLKKEGRDVHIRTIQRDLDKLSIDFPLVSAKEGRENLWQWAKGAFAMEIPSMSPSTALVFQLVEQYLNPLLPRSTLDLIKPYMGRAAEILKATNFHAWRSNVRTLSRGPNLIPPRISNNVQDVVYSALLEKKRFEVSYRPRLQKKIVTYKVNPLGLVIKEGITYLVCTLWDYKDYKQLALHRMQSATLTDTPAKGKTGFDLTAYIEKDSSFAYPVSDGKLKLKIRMDKAAAFHLYESKLSKDQQIVEVDDTNVQLTATVNDDSEIRWWLLGFGDQVEVLEPDNLRDEFVKTARSLNTQYSQ